MFVTGTIATADDSGLELFEKKIRPLLVEHCYECHAAGAKKLGGKLLLDHRAGVLAGGESGAVVVPGKPEKSLLIAAVKYSDDASHMPPRGKLPDAAIADLEMWIKLGAPDPREAPTNPTTTADSWETILAERRTLWSLQPVQRPAVPMPKDAVWSANPIDRFVLARLEERGLSPAPPADMRTLARRLSLVLTGLLPREADIESLVASVPPSPTRPLSHSGNEGESGREGERAKEQIAYVDKLLASPHFGERWARHWMDVVRFTETHGNEWNYEVHHAWRYRDYLIRALNDDVPYDQFIREHIAGDLLPQPRINQAERFNESVIGTAFYRFGEVNHDDCISLRQIGYDILDNQIDTLTKAFQATTVACARCHDHKLDAVSMHDYYALLGVLRSSRLVSHTTDLPDANAAELARLAELKAQIRSELAKVWLAESSQFAAYLQAAYAKRSGAANAEELAKNLHAGRLEQWVAALAADKQPLEEPLQALRDVAAVTPVDGDAFAKVWSTVREKFAAEDAKRVEASTRDYVTWADFREAWPADWQIGGLGLRGGPSKSGELVVLPEGDSIASILPAGTFTHALSQRQNGTLRSPVVPAGKKHISFQVMGQRSSALRLVSNLCQLNYKNYKALTSGDFTWITFDPPPDANALRTYAELMTMLDNPKFPDQLSALGGDTANYKLPWDKAAENPRSYFGITRVVLHHTDQPPPAELSHLRQLLRKEPVDSLAKLIADYADVMTAALNRWQRGEATDDDVRWIDCLLKRGLIDNRPAASPQLDSLVKQYREIEAKLPSPRIIPGIADGGPGIEQPLFIRGDCFRPGDTTPRRYLEVLANSRDGFASPGSGRLELAERIASPANPLTARVMVNRVWHHLFGTGLVATVDDFGHVGERPSHPELLDHLAAEFMADGWSVKRLIRRIVLSRTFQLASPPPERADEVDPQNRLLSHYPARRLEAEAIRDSLLAASGRLDPQLYGPSIQPYREKEYADRRLFPGPLDGAGRRSVYIKTNLMETPKFLGAFNLPGGKVTQGRRDVTNVPAQALAMLNDPLVLDQSRFWAKRLVARSDKSAADRIDHLFRTALSRPPTDVETARFEQAALDLAGLHGVPSDQILASEPIWTDLAHTIFNLQEFVYIP